MSTYPTLIDKAVKIAVEAHWDQKRKDGPPYIIHPFQVALLLRQHGFSDEVVAAGLVHDVLEDTEYPEQKLREALGDTVYSIVRQVTNDDSLSWVEKKKKYIQSVRDGSVGAKAVATADKIQNLESLLDIAQHEGREVWKRFNAGRDQKLWFEDAMLSMLKETWPHPLVDSYATLLEEMRAIPSD